MRRTVQRMLERFSTHVVYGDGTLVSSSMDHTETWIRYLVSTYPRSGTARLTSRETRALFDYLVPVIRFRAARRAHRWNARMVGCPVSRDDLDDFVQDVLFLLFMDEARVLRSWNPARGLSLRNYVGLIAERQMGHMLRSKLQLALLEQQAAIEAGRHSEGSCGPEATASARQELSSILERVRMELSTKGRHVLESLLRGEHPTATAGIEEGMSRDALYAWRSRIAKRMNSIAKTAVDS